MTQVTPQQAATAERLYNEGRALYSQAEGMRGAAREPLLIAERTKYQEALEAAGISVESLRLPLEQRLARSAPPAIALTRLPQPIQNAAYNLARRYHEAAYAAIARPDLTPPMADAARRGLEVALGISDALVRGPGGEQIADPMAHVEFAAALTDLVRLRVRNREIGELEARMAPVPGQQAAGVNVVSQSLGALEFARYSLLTAAQVNGSPIQGRGVERTELFRQLNSVNTDLTMASIDASRLVAEAATTATDNTSPALSTLRSSAMVAMPRNAYGRAWLEWFVRVNRPAYDGSTDPSTMLRYRAQFQQLRQGVEQRLGAVQ